ncbi:hypothetical protein L227DRAFT_571158 [Lentinus tigrinus ALCF2SS1-6]|uniref:F-box domain-containing protein n=2 Tax=Lentinus tigrinus TaxID=5365 RepID=A0A5C2SLG3_9APHY|nr:hypothetical protein L227DRAFT_571158 [Lentinus tigrinus ALCF2SS1-6]
MVEEGLQLPIDIIHTIFDQLCDEKKSLAACSLVCKAWEPASRSRLFCSIKTEEWKSSFLALERFFTAVPHLTSYISQLSLVGLTVFELTDSSIEFVYGSTLDVSLLARILTKLPALRRLYLIDLAYEGILVPFPLAPRPSLDLLVFQNVPPLSHTNSTLPELLGVIALFSYIGRLTFIGDNAEVEHDADGLAVDDYEIPGQVDIRGLELKHISGKVLAAVTHAICKSSPLEFNRRLETFTVCIHDTYECVDIIGNFLRSFRHSIKHVDFDPMVLYIRSDAEYDAWDKLHLSECSNLASLTLSLELPSIALRAYDAIERCFGAYKLILSQPLPSALEQVTLRFKPNPFISSLQWVDMDHVLCRIPSLKSVVIDFRNPIRTPMRMGDGPTGVGAFAPLVAAPGLRAKGILGFRMDISDVYAPLYNMPL